MRSGGDLAYVFVSEEACGSVKSYSPDLIVIPVYGNGWGLDNTTVSPGG